jgi:DDE superfamily endonuclease
MRPGQPERRGHDYTRHGTRSLFAAPETATGKIIGRCFARHRAREFRAFLNTVEASMPADHDVHLVIDNVSSHKTEAVRNWFARRPRWHVNYTPTSASWINQVERFFSDLMENQIRRGLTARPTNWKRPSLPISRRSTRTRAPLCGSDRPTTSSPASSGSAL